MITFLYSVYDSKSCCFGIPFIQMNDGIAKRSFTDVVNDPSTLVFRHPTDFILYKVGEFDDSSAMVHAITPVLSLGNAAEYKRDRAPIEVAKVMATVVQSDGNNSTEEVLR